MTLSHETKRNIMDDLANHTTEQLREKVTKGKDGKLNGDNLDIYVTTNEVRLDNKNKDLHFFASDFTFDRVDIKELESTKPLKNIANVTPYDFVPSGTENDIYKKSLKVLIGRIIVDYIDYFKWMKPVLPSHIPHPLEDDMEKKSEIFWLPVMIKNEAYYSDCVQIMDDYEKQLADWYTKAGRGILIVT